MYINNEIVEAQVDRLNRRADKPAKSDFHLHVGHYVINKTCIHLIHFRFNGYVKVKYTKMQPIDRCSKAFKKEHLICINTFMVSFFLVQKYLR